MFRDSQNDGPPVKHRRTTWNIIKKMHHHKKAKPQESKEVEKRIKYQKIILAKLLQLKPQPVKKIQETVSDRIIKYIYIESDFKGFFNVSADLIRELQLVDLLIRENYCQTILLSKINYYLSMEQEEKISEEGYCHGLVLFWLAMMSWGIENLFFEMIKIIVECPDEQLPKIRNLIKVFLGCMDVGQNPHKYSNEKCGKED